MKAVKRLIIIGLILAVLGGIAFGIYMGYKKFDEFLHKDDDAWKIEIVIDKVNIRSDHTNLEAKIGEAKKGVVYKVLEIYLEDDKFVWYKVSLGKDSEGWIASSRKEPYVKEINNPKSLDSDEASEEYFIEYNPPVVKYYEDVYEVDNIENITYDHLEITDESEYTVSHEVYYEEKPKDSNIPQYWIQYVVTDKFGNTTKKVQKIEFQTKPKSSQVKDFKKLKR